VGGEAEDAPVSAPDVYRKPVTLENGRTGFFYATKGKFR